MAVFLPLSSVTPEVLALNAQLIGMDRKHDGAAAVTYLVKQREELASVS